MPHKGGQWSPFSRKNIIVLVKRQFPFNSYSKVCLVDSTVGGVHVLYINKIGKNGLLIKSDQCKKNHFKVGLFKKIDRLNYI